MIEGTSIARQGVFEKIYASSFYFNSKGVAKMAGSGGELYQ